MPQIQLNELSKRYDNGINAVTKVTLELPANGFVLLTGPTNGGKSTLLRIIAGIEQITEGALFFDGKEMNAVQASERNVALLFKNSVLYPEMTAYDNIGYSLRLKKVPEEEVDKRITAISEILGLTPALHHKPNNLSDAQAMLVLIARGAVRYPCVYLLDDPLSVLDRTSQQHCFNALRNLHAALKTSTFIYATDNLADSKSIATNIVMLKDGTLLQAGSIDALVKNPKNGFMVGFINGGSVHFIDATVQKNESGAMLFIDDNTIVQLSSEISIPLLEKGYVNKDIIIGLSIHSLRLIPNNQKNTTACVIETVVSTIVNENAREFLKLNIAGNEFKIPDTTFGVKPGDTVTLCTGKTPLYVFDKLSEETILTVN